ncbi:MAG: ribosome small subunit-dependent GTPase A [Lachnospiraceae bacterium]|nr:ribosome small subunit-dependent GTPase A [Lachnospiraceae bacterium]
MVGKIIKGVAGEYCVHVEGMGAYTCKAKGVFRHKNMKPLVGDNVEIDIIDEDEGRGNIIDIHERKSELIRPAVANIDQTLVVFAAKSPMPNRNLLDRFLVMMESQGMESILCFNKMDLAEDEEIEELKSTYEKAGYRVMLISVKDNVGVDEVKELLAGKTTSLAGPSGVGKSSLLNVLVPDALMETGDISRKIERGKHTTRHSEIFSLGDSTYLMDTPGFSSIYTCPCEKEQLKEYFPEIYEYEGQCRFNGCVHINEPDCAVKEAVKAGNIGQSRYDNYAVFFGEIKDRKKYN